MRQHEKRGEMDKRLCYSGLGKHALFCVIRRHGRARGKYGRVHVKKTTNILTSNEAPLRPPQRGFSTAERLVGYPVRLFHCLHVGLNEGALGVGQPVLVVELKVNLVDVLRPINVG
jgi:hypothetical protein